MIAYFDTSAVVPLLVAEPGSPRTAALWECADRVLSVRLVYPEGRAALARARRVGRIDNRQLRDAVTQFDLRYDELDLIEIDAEVARHAGDLAQAHSLRGYDAVHLAAARRLYDPDLVVVAGDRALLEAALSEGIAVAHTGPPVN